jgi:hydantoinase/carbamoylase family amidase
MSRLALSDSDKQARDWFAKTTKALDCTVTVDTMGNQFAVRKGKREGPPTCAGSHLDTQPTGGRYDGILGIHSGIEMLKVLHDAKAETEFPIGLINWTNEEGARFPISVVSSGVWAGELPLEKAHDLASVVKGDKSTMLSELKRIGYLGEVECSHEATPIAAHFELHIEQGSHLERESKKIGIVEGIQAYRWFTINVEGCDCHTGTTPLDGRSDALLAACKMIVTAREIAHKMGVLASVGIIDAHPGSTNVVPGSVTFSLDVRAPTDKMVQKAEQSLRKAFDWIASGNLPRSLQALKKEAQPDVVKCEWRQDADNPATNFHEDCIQCVTESAGNLFGRELEVLTKRMVSGAGHDSMYTSRRVPTVR